MRDSLSGTPGSHGLRRGLKSYAASRLQLHLPAFAHGGTDVLIGLGTIGEAQILAVPIELAGNAVGDRDQAEPLGIRRGDAEIGTAGIATFAGTNPIQHVAR